MKITRVWQDFLDTINSDGFHIVLLVGLFIWLHDKPALEKYSGEVMGALLMYLKMAGSNQSRRERSHGDHLPPTDPPTS